MNISLLPKNQKITFRFIENYMNWANIYLTDSGETICMVNKYEAPFLIKKLPFFK